MDKTINKSTHALTLWQPILKSTSGEYIAVLSDDSIDRDDEIISKQAIQKIKDSDGYTAMLLNHENNVLGQIGEWVNKRVETIGEHTAFIAEPKFYLSNPSAQIIKGCLDEGAAYGISISAIPKSWEYVEKNGKKYKSYTDIELLEASWVAIPSNRHGVGFAVAKMFSSDKRGSKKMSDEIIKQDDMIQPEDKPVEPVEPVEDKPTEPVEPVEDSNVELGKSITKQSDELKKVISESLELKNKLEELNKAYTSKMAEMKDQIEKSNKELEELKNLAVMKGNMETTEGDIVKSEEIKKQITAGNIPVVNKI